MGTEIALAGQVSSVQKDCEGSETDAAFFLKVHLYFCVDAVALDIQTNAKEMGHLYCYLFLIIYKQSGSPVSLLKIFTQQVECIACVVGSALLCNDLNVLPAEEHGT